MRVSDYKTGLLFILSRCPLCPSMTMEELMTRLAATDGNGVIDGGEVEHEMKNRTEKLLCFHGH
jgi:hypothetical protein